MTVEYIDEDDLMELDEACDAAAEDEADEKTGEGSVEEQHPAAPASGDLAPLRPEKDDEGYLFHYPRASMPELPFAANHIPAANAETEALLNGLIGECGSLLRDVAFRSACLTPDAADRLRFISAAESLVLTATKVADSIGRLRHGEPQHVEAHRHELVYTHVHTSPHPPAAGSDVQ